MNNGGQGDPIMIRYRSISLAIFIASMAAASPARAQTTPHSVIYSMARESEFAWGCFGPCMCPVLVRQPLLGTFELTRTGIDPQFEYYSVTNVRWRLTDTSTPVTIVGSGTYRRGGEVAVQEQLTLDLSFDGGDPQHFDSGLLPAGAPFPEIRTTISLHGGFCFDSLFTVDAKPLGTASNEVADNAHPLIAIPSPFHGSTDVEFMLSRAGRIDLDVVDVTGRQIRSLAHGEWNAAGRHRRAWDGSLASGGTAPPGLYFVRLATVSGVRSRAIVKLR